MNMLYSFIIAISFLTIIPMPYIEWKDGRSDYTSIFIPVVGLIVGGLGLLAYQGLCLLPVNEGLKGALLTAYFLIITGGIHFDGLMDTADAYFSRRDLARKLEIMKDSRVGAFAVMAAILVLMVKAGALTQLFLNNNVSALAIVCVPVMSRALQASMLYVFPQAKADGMGNMLGYHLPKATALYFFAIIAGAAALLYRFAGVRSLAVCGALLLFYVFYYFSSKKNFGGVTGDMLGAFVELSETVMWFAVILAV